MSVGDATEVIHQQVWAHLLHWGLPIPSGIVSQVSEGSLEIRAKVSILVLLLFVHTVLRDERKEEC